MPAPKKKATDDANIVQILPANMVVATIRIRGSAPYVQEAFSRRTANDLMGHMATPAAAQKGKKGRPVRNYEEEFEQAQHKSVPGWVGIPCTAFRRAMVDACRTVSVVMVTAKMAVFIVPDGFDAADGTPLVRLHSPKGPEQTSMPVRNANGNVDIRVRPMWREWYADVQVRFDADMITPQSVVNLLDRAGQQVGIGAGRPFSKQSVGQGWGTFTVDQQPVNKEEVA